MNRLYYGDNLDILKKYIEDNSVDLIYIDPPFNSKRNYNIIYDGAVAQAEAFKDTWSLRSLQDEKRLIFIEEAQRYSKIHNVIDAWEKLLINSNPSLFGYLVNMSIRLVELHRVLKDTGSFYLHCDPTASHYLKLILDQVFGIMNFKNEIAWCYTSPGHSKRDFQRKHDIIFRYTKSDNFTFNQQFIPYKSGIHVKDDGDVLAYKDTVKPSQKVEFESRGKPIEDWWSDIYPTDRVSDERLGYPTQKPEMLLERIIKASSNEGDVVLDAFCGCGTTVAVAQRLNRKWIGLDITFLSIDLIRQRLLDSFYRNTLGLNEKEAQNRFYEEVEIFGIPKDLESARQLATRTEGDRIRKEFEKWTIFSVGGIYFEKKGADTGIDGYFFFYDVKGGKAKKMKGLIQVKSGKVGVKDIRDFSHVLKREDMPLGIFITLENPTKPMLDEIAKMPQFTSGQGRSYPKIIIVTVKDIIDDNLPNIPVVRATKKAPPARKESKQNTLFKTLKQ